MSELSIWYICATPVVTLDNQHFVLLRIQFFVSERDVANTMTWLDFSYNQMSFMEDTTDVQSFSMFWVTTGKSVLRNFTFFCGDPSHFAIINKDIEVLFGVCDCASWNVASVATFNNTAWRQGAVVRGTSNKILLPITSSTFHSCLMNCWSTKWNPNWNLFSTIAYKVQDFINSCNFWRQTMTSLLKFILFKVSNQWL